MGLRSNAYATLGIGTRTPEDAKYVKGLVDRIQSLARGTIALEAELAEVKEGWHRWRSKNSDLKSEIAELIATIERLRGLLEEDLEYDESVHGEGFCACENLGKTCYFCRVRAALDNLREGK